MSLITQLGYLGLNVRDYDAWRPILVDVLGMHAQQSGPSEPLYFQVDQRHHRIALHQSATNATAYVGWEVADARALDATATTLELANIEVTRGSDTERELRRVQDLIKFTDLNGIPMEIYYGAAASVDELPLSRATSGFLTGGLGLGHVVCASKQPEASMAFYCDTLGFRLSDTIAVGPMWLSFLRCNPRHHSLAFGSERPGGTRAGQISHLMVEAKHLDDVGLAYDLCQEMHIPVWMSLGKHTNDHLISFYLITPSGFAIEYGYGGLEVDEATWEVEHLDSATIWGHRIVTPKPPG